MSRILLFLFLELGEAFVQLGLNLLHTFIGVFGGRVQLFLQETQANVSLAELLALETPTTSQFGFSSRLVCLNLENQSFTSP